MAFVEFAVFAEFDTIKWVFDNSMNAIVSFVFSIFLRNLRECWANNWELWGKNHRKWNAG